MNRSLSTIAVDVTPVLPSGENGGAKIFVLELLNRLVEMAPQTQFVLLVRAAKTMNLGERILFPGYLPNAELAALSPVPGCGFPRAV